MKKTILIACLIFVGLPVMAVGVFVIVNWKDEALLPEVSKFLDWQPPAHAFEDNGYLIFRGINAPEDQDPAKLGRQISEAGIKRYLALRDTFDSSESTAQSDDFPPHDLKEALCAYAKTGNCVEFYLQSDKNKLASLLSSQKALIDRFIAVQHSRNYIEITPPSFKVEFPAYKYLVDASELRRIQAIAEIKDGNFKNGITLLAENAQFSRRLLSSSKTLVSHMIALAMVQHDMRILSELMTKYPRIAGFKEELLPLLMPISEDEYSMTKPFAGELDMTLNYFNSLRSSLDRDRPAFPVKLNATLNLAYRTGMARMDVAGADANRLDDAMIAYEKKREAMTGFSILHFLHLYNPGGKLLLKVGEPLFIRYVERHHDTDGYIRLVATQAKLISENVPADKIPETLKILGLDFCNPYTGQPMEWDPERRKLIFRGRQPSSQLPNKGNLYEIQLPAQT